MHLKDRQILGGVTRVRYLEQIKGLAVHPNDRIVQQAIDKLASNLERVIGQIFRTNVKGGTGRDTPSTSVCANNFYTIHIHARINRTKRVVFWILDKRHRPERCRMSFQSERRCRLFANFDLNIGAKWKIRVIRNGIETLPSTRNEQFRRLRRHCLGRIKTRELLAGRLHFTNG